MLEGANMDENDKPDGSTAMERLCRELMDAVVSCAPTVWCGEHGIGIHGTRLEQDRENARADISRRIDGARDEDDGSDGYAAVALKALTGMHRGHAMCTRGEVDEMVGAVEGWKAKAAELDALRGAGRVVPEGCRWPSFGDGGRLDLGGEAWTKGGGHVRVVAVSHRGRAAVRPWWRKDGRGARWVPLSSLLGERPAPKALGADGVEVKAGDTVWLAPERRGMAQCGTRESGDTCGLSGVDALDRLAVVYTRDRSGVPIASLDRCQAWCPASWLTHTAPCTDKDGAPIDEGDEVWTEDGCRWKVLGIKSGGHPVQAQCVEGCHRGKRRDLKWTWVSHERPDSWERLREYAMKNFVDYWGCAGKTCDKCPALVDGKKPSERYGTAGCHTAEQLDLLARAERLAGVQGE